MLGNTKLKLLSAAACLLWGTCVVGSPLDTEKLKQRQDADSHWVATWTSMPQLVEQNNLPPSPFVSVTISPSHIRILWYLMYPRRPETAYSEMPRSGRRSTCLSVPRESVSRFPILLAAAPYPSRRRLSLCPRAARPVSAASMLQLSGASRSMAQRR